MRIFFGLKATPLNTLQKAKNKGSDQSARMRRLVCTFVIHIPRRQVFERRGTCDFEVSHCDQIVFSHEMVYLILCVAKLVLLNVISAAKSLVKTLNLCNS